MGLGLSSAKLAHLTRHLDRCVSEGRFPSVACLVHRHGQEAYFHASGMADESRGREIARDSVYRIYSMTKPITSVGMMMLYERGLFQLDDPVSKFLPGWSGMEVYVAGKGKHMSTRKASEQPCIKHLLTHTAGLTYGFMDRHPVDAMYRKLKIATDLRHTLKENTSLLVKVPLLFDPGTRWSYSVATDVCGHLVEVLSGKPFDEFLNENVLMPLGMRDTGFCVTPRSRERLTACYLKNKKGYELQDDPVGSEYDETPAFFSAGGGMVSTIDDYARFAQMLLNGGELDGHRILGRKTVEYMAINHLPGGVDLAEIGQQVFSETPYDGIGFGLGFSVVLDPAKASVLDSLGSFGWGGAASTYFWIDPMEDLAVVFMSQLLPSSAWPIRRELKALVYQALID